MTWPDFFRRNWLQVGLLIIAPFVCGGTAFVLLSNSDAGSVSVLNVRTWHSYDKDLPGDGVAKSLLFAIIVLVVLNTLAYLIDAYKSRTGSVAALGTLSLLPIVIWAAITVGVKHLLRDDPDNHVNELIMIGVFALFTCVDSWQLKRVCGNLKKQISAIKGDPLKSVGRKSAKSRRRKLEIEKLRTERQTYLLQLISVDAPVIIGLLFVSIVSSSYVYGSSGLVVDLYKLPFDVGFRSGAAVMHVAFSQVVFLSIYAFISIPQCYKIERELEELEKSVVSKQDRASLRKHSEDGTGVTRRGG